MVRAIRMRAFGADAVGHSWLETNMTRMYSPVLFLFLSCLSLVAAFAQQEPITQQDVIRLLELKIPQDQILERVKGSGTVFVLGAQDIEKLKKVGAGDELLAAMGAGKAGSASAIEMSDASTAEITDLALVVDYSGSMNAKTPDGVTKVEAAKKAVEALIEKLPDDLNVALVVYGTSKAKDCNDITIVQPLSKIDKALLKSKALSFSAVGMTPIAGALTKAGEALVQSAGGRAIILVTDGAESCNGNPTSVASEMAKKHGTKFGLHVIGFDLKAAERQALEGVASAGRGKYFNADNAAQLADAMQKVTKQIAQATPAQRETRAYTASGQAVAGGTWFTDAAQIAAGEFQGQLALKEARYYKIPVQKGQEIRAIGQFKKTPLPGNAYYNAPIAQDFIVTIYSSNLEPVAREVVQTTENPTAPVTVRATWTADEDGFAYISIAASQNYVKGTGWAALQTDAKTIAPSGYTLRIRAEGAAAGASASPVANLTVQPGTGFADAGVIDGTGLVGGDLKFDETAFFSVPVQKDQPLEFSVAVLKPWEARSGYYYPQKALYTITLYDDDQVEAAKETIEIKDSPPDASGKTVAWNPPISGKAYISISLTNIGQGIPTNAEPPGPGRFALLFTGGAGDVGAAPGDASGSPGAPDAVTTASDAGTTTGAELRKPLDPFSGAEAK